MTNGADADAGTTREGEQPFYTALFGEAELREALSHDDIDEEIAVLRLKLRKHLADQPGDLDVMLKSIALIVRAAATRYRMSDRRAADLGAAIAATIDLLDNELGK